MTSEVTPTSTTEINETAYPIPSSSHIMRRVTTCITRVTTIQPPKPTAIANQFRVEHPRNYDSPTMQQAALAYLQHTRQAYDNDQSFVQQIARHLYLQIESLEQAHRQLSQELKNMLPTGIIHLLLTSFAQMLYTDKWQPKGGKVIASLLVTYKLERYLPEEHVAQILALLQHDLSAPLHQVTKVHPSMERLVYATLNLKRSTQLQPYHICQALLCSLLSYTTQKETNCYIIATIPYLIGNHPADFLDHLYTLLFKGCVYVNNLRVDLTFFFPMLAIVQDSDYPITSIEFLSSSVITRVLTAHCLQQAPLSLPAQTPLKLLEKCTTSPAQYEELCTYLRGMQDDLLIQLFVLSTELRYINHEAKACKETLATIKKKLIHLLVDLPDSISEKIASDVMHSLVLLAPQQSYLQSCMPSNIDALGKNASLYTKAHFASIFLCSHHDGQLKIHHALSDWIAHLNNMIQQAFQTYDRHQVLSPPRSAHDDLTLEEFAFLFASNFWTFSKDEQQELCKACTRLDRCLLPRPLGYVTRVMNKIRPDYWRFEHHGSAITAECFTTTLNREILRYCSAPLPPYLIVQLNTHFFTIHLTPQNPLRLPSIQFREVLDNLKRAGHKVLSQHVLAEDVIACVRACYPCKQDADLILSRLDPVPIKTFRDLRDALLQAIDPEDTTRIKQHFNCHMSSYLPANIPFTLVLKKLDLDLDADKVCQQFQDESTHSPQHPYHLCCKLRNLFISNGHHVSIFMIQEALQKLGLKPHIKIGDLNYSYSINQQESPHHSHLLIEFNYTTEHLEFFETASTHVVPNPQQSVKDFNLVFPHHFSPPNYASYIKI